jgi:hypothetical protein
VRLLSIEVQRANLQGANLQGAILQGADLVGAINLTQTQIDAAITDRNTKVPGQPQVPKVIEPRTGGPF